MNTRIHYIFITIIAAFVLMAKAAPLDSAVGHEGTFRLAGDGYVVIADVETGEAISVRYRTGSGIYDTEALEKINRLMRCHGTNEIHSISLKLVEFMDYLQDEFRASVVLISSGYRSPSYNTALAHRLRRAAHDSLHKQGMAADIKLPGVDKKQFGKFARLSNFGGVGQYRRVSFTHVDSGPIRSW